MQQKSVHLSLLKFKSFIFSKLPLFLITDSILLFMEETSTVQISGEMFSHSSEITFSSCSLLEGLCGSTSLFKRPKFVLLDASQATYLA